MKTFQGYEAPLKLFGIPFFEEKQVFERLPLALREKIPTLEFLGRRCPGARIGFRTDAEEFTVHVTFKTLTCDIGMSIFASQSVNVMVGPRENSRFIGIANPPDYETKTFEKTFHKAAEMEEVTLWLPRNEELESISVSFPDEARIEPPTPYRARALYYGSSITEGGCCCNNTNNYNALLCRWLNLDYINFGFSGSAMGEPDMADYINTIPMDIFVMDYDHNAPDVAHLQKTHEPFFRQIRKQHPALPILLMTCPNFDHMPEAAARRAVVRTTYENALAAGDQHVYFVDGETFFGEKDRQLCTIDTTHPNDLGFYRMAEAILPTMQTILASIGK